MPATDSQLETILRYFDGELSSDEEQQLLLQLQHDTSLQQAFDQQILMHRFTPTEPEVSEKESTPEPADQFLGRFSEPVKNGSRNTPVVPVLKRDYWRISVAAAVVACLLAALVYYYFQYKSSNKLVIKTTAKDSLATIKPKQQQQDSPVTAQGPKPIMDSTPSLQQLYADNYKPFPKNSLEVPVAAQEYQNLYEQHSYQEMAAQNEADMEVKGQADPREEEQAIACFRFYKALASIEVNKLPQAEKLFTGLLHADLGSSQLKSAVRWYLLMIYLKKGDKKHAGIMAAVLAGSAGTPYYRAAATIKAVLQKRKESGM